MPAPQLELSDDCLSHPVPADLITLGANMLWPDDLDVRDRAVKSGHLKILISDWVIPQELAQQISSDALDATPMVAIQESAKLPFVHGFIAGTILHTIVSEVAVEKNSDRASMQRVIADLSKIFYPRWRLAPKTIENTVWPQFRKVAHYWAAYIQGTFSQPPEPFPCRLANLSGFLSTAEAFRHAGEATRTKRSPRPILLPSESVILSPNIVPKKFTLEFGG
jgi:hypothetical protein